MPEKKPDPKHEDETPESKPSMKDTPKPQDEDKEPQEVEPKARSKAKPESKDEEAAPPPPPAADTLHTDPLLLPESQQPFESGEDYRKRVGKPEPQPGVFDESISRGEDPR